MPAETSLQPTISELRKHDKYDRLLERARALPKLKVAVPHPYDDESLGAILDAASLGLIEPILVGPLQKIAAAAAKLKPPSLAFDLSARPIAMRLRRKPSPS
jgi:phosphate acetyltransferase